MVFGNIVSSPLSSLSSQQALKLANVYLESAYNADDDDVALVLCHDTEVSLNQAKKGIRHSENHYETKEIATAYGELGRLLDSRGHCSEAVASYRKAEKLEPNVQDSGRLTPTRHTPTTRPINIKQSLSSIRSLYMDGYQSPSSERSFMTIQPRQRYNVATVSADIFVENVIPPTITFKPPEPDERLINTPQLASCLYLLQDDRPSDEVLEPAARDWLKVIEKDTDEQDRLKTLATEVIRAYKRDEIKDAKIVAEVAYLAPVLDKDSFQDLLREFYFGIDQYDLLKFHQLEGLAQLIQSADQSLLSADDLARILGLLSNRLKDTHQQPSQHMYQLALAVSCVLDAMADTKVIGLDRERLHEPLSIYLKELKGSNDPYLVYQAAYSFQALLWVPDNDTTWQAAMRIFKGVAGMACAAKGLNLDRFMESLNHFQRGLSGASKVAEVVKNTYDGVQGVKGLLEALRDGFSFERKRDWYSALRGADALIQDGEFASFRKLVCEAPCRLDPAFQWGVCQRLGEIAANPMWNADIRRGAIAFLGEIYRNDEVWGQHASVKQWILNILMQLAPSSATGSPSFNTNAEALLRELEMSGDDKKQALYRSCRAKGPIAYPLKISQPELPSPSLLDRVQNRPDVEGNLRLLRKQRTKERGNAVYIPPQSKASLQAADSARFPLMERVKEFLKGDQKVFLLLGDSGSGKSTFNRELEFELWQSYKKTGSIPLHINLPAIDKPEHDMIAKQLRKAEFTEPQIREMKHYRRFIVICDGYDESQQTHNLYKSNRLNEAGEWNAQMVISCRSEYVGAEYKDRFQPGDRNRQSDSTLFQEAVITPFSWDQVQDYIQQYVNLHQPLWQVRDYKQALDLIPSLKELVRNPFLMTLSLEVLPRMVDPGLHLSEARVTRVGLYDHFVEQWLERGKKRLGEKDMSPQARAAFESLNDEGFTRNGIEYLKKLAISIYREQAGLPIVEYSRFVDEGSWKDVFFGRDDKQLLREACPLKRNGNQHRFIHRSILEYGLARAVYDPQDRRMRGKSELLLGRRGSASSVLSFELEGPSGEQATTFEQEPDLSSPLVWRSFVNDHSLLQFLEERVQQEPAFKAQLLTYIEHSKKDKKWRKAAANAITILVRSGEQFIGADLRNVRIPGADLSYGVFDSAQLQNADLRKVNLRGVWLRQTDLSGAQMTGVQFGELPYLSEDNSVRSCAYSPDGKSFAVGFYNGNISVYSTSNWERSRKLSGHGEPVRRIMYSPRGDQLASASQDRTVRLWDAITGLQIHVLKDHTLYVHGVAYSPKGDLIASGSDDKSVRIWDVVTGDCRRVFSGHTRGVLSVAYSPNGNQVASSSADFTVRLWSLETGSCSRILSSHTDKVWEVAYSPSGDQLASVSADQTVQLYDAETGERIHVLRGHSSTVYSVFYSPKGDYVASGSLDGTVRLWDAETGANRQTLTGHNDVVTVVAYSPKGDQVASGSFDKTLRLWDVSADSFRCASHGHSAGVVTIKCSPKGDRIASGSMDRTIRLWDAETGTCRRTFIGHTDTVFSVAYSPQGDLIASGGADRSVRLWRVESGDCQHILTGHTHWVNCVTLSPEGDMVASASEDNTVWLWDVLDGGFLRTLGGHTEGVMSVTFSSNGAQIATGSKDKTVRLWKVVTGECQKVLRGHNNWIRDVVYSPQGEQLASASVDKTVRIWDVQTGECRLTLTGHTHWIMGVTYSANGKMLASGGWDKTVRLWDISTGECQAVVQNFQNPIRCIAWSNTSDTSYLITGGGDGSVLKWQVMEEDQCRVQLRWGASNGALTMTGASIHGARGLTVLNKQLLKQRGATGEPENLFREAGKRIITMSSVVSNFRKASEGTLVGSPLATSPSTEPYEQKQPEQSEESISPRDV